MDDFTSDFVLEIEFNFREMLNIEDISEICSHMKRTISAKWPNILLISSVKKPANYQFPRYHGNW